MKDSLDDTFFVANGMKEEMHYKYNELEGVVKALNKVRQGLTGFTQILDPYREMYSVIVPNRPIDTGLGVLPLQKIVVWISTILLPILLLFIGLPIASGFIRLPWKETGIIVLCVVAIYGINIFKRKIGVSN